jgi:cellulose synthase/poly-beta-1,6-N-acetylglucosamine synthase-like glycosyltransferase
MVQVLLPVFLALLAFFSGSYVLYLAYVRSGAKKPWRLEIDNVFLPGISILIPVRNEEGAIWSKLENVKSVSYPKGKMEVVVADDASEDNTLKIVKHFMEENPELKIKVVSQRLHAGKAAALNEAIASCTHPIVILSDADTHWPNDILQKTLPYLSDHRVGAVTGRGINRNVNESWVTKGEETYLSFMQLLRVGESKIYSTVKFEGGFCAFKKEAFEKFDCESGSDDSGTALEVVQNGYRAILVPEAVFYTEFPTRLIDKLRVKARRANQWISLRVKILRLMLRGQLHIPKKLAVPEILLFLVDPVVFICLIVGAILIVALNPLSPFSLLLVLFVAGLLLFAHRFFFEVLLDNLILFYALITYLFGKRYVAWEKRESNFETCK